MFKFFSNIVTLKPAPVKKDMGF